MSKVIINYVLDLILFIGCLVSILRGSGDWYDYWFVYGLLFITPLEIYLCVRKHKKHMADKKNAES